jgi:hypothetical protein
MVGEAQIRGVIADYIASGDASSESANAFLMAFSRLTYNIHETGTPEAYDLANQVEFLLSHVRSECGGCKITKEQFRKRLSELA